MIRALCCTCGRTQSGCGLLHRASLGGTEFLCTNSSALNHSQLLALHRNRSQFAISAKKLITGIWLLVPSRGSCSHWGHHCPQRVRKERALQPSPQPPHSMGLRSSSTAVSCCAVFRIAWGQCHWQAWVLLPASSGKQHLGPASVPNSQLLLLHSFARGKRGECQGSSLLPAVSSTAEVTLWEHSLVCRGANLESQLALNGLVTPHQILVRMLLFRIKVTWFQHSLIPLVMELS